MPIYQYACPDCGHKFELKQRFSDNPVRKCPQCGRYHVYRVVGQVAVTFKGSGWYITDNRSSSDKRMLEHSHKETPATGNAATDNTSTGATTPSPATATMTAEKTETKPAQSAAKTETEKPKKA
jgi:putative FmdB family regulatory protein